MQPIGVVGGIGPESTIDYYRAMIAAYRERQPDGSYPPIVMTSIDPVAMLGGLMRGETGAVIDAVILGGTELPLILRDATASDLPLLDTTVIHAKAIVARAMDTR